MKGRRFRALDGLRGVCAVVVALYHYSPNFHFKQIAVIHQAWMFVDFFFVLSGFVIAHAYEHRLMRAGAAGAFVLRRIGRLWPLHVVVLTLFCLGEIGKIVTSRAGIHAQHPAFTGNFSLLHLPENLVFLQALNDPPTWNSVSWSISVEFWTYLVFCAACLASGRLRPALYGVLASMGLVMVVAFSPNGMMTDTLWGFFRCIYGFFVGALTWHLWHRIEEKLPRSNLMEVGSIALVLLLFHCVTIAAVMYSAPLVFAAVVLVFAREGGGVSALLRSRSMQALGVWSYGIYMLHPFVLQDLLTRGATLLQHVGGLAMVAPAGSGPDGVPMTIVKLDNLWWGDLLVLAYALILIGLASLTYRWVEEPGRRMFNKLGNPDTRRNSW